MKAIAISFYIVFSVATVLARLGETEEQIQQRYGEPVGKPTDETRREKSGTYIYNGFCIIVTFLDGKSHMEGYMKEDRKSKLSDAEIAVLLNANSFGNAWEAAEGSTSTDKKWTLGGTAIALYFPMHDPPTLMIATSEYRIYVNKRNNAKELKNLEGF